ncbi:putative elongation of fatty acids protein [Saitoella complicata NRRL Y-17804]|uniref:putative elongation of fatty acids protein n=1 Tax=Saitoella complicata (strain BCRC 22490 / CBS 7301 / JCM 7358 / NBRC 10748 / NRRL Y-17804) TaxID=698492 RepID=UPI0008677FD9|nr:putative elongation of fatty acids protein [Saitoella complicata NRRL Y-17804]ODQ54161.1 putative elongation of fatty acids protein [Saitoella complicata NRRL Y-17804]
MLEVSVPSIDRPFGVYLWPLFDAAWEKVMGYPAHDFDFVPGKTPMSTVREVVAALVTYYIVIFGGRAIMKNFSPLKLNFFFQVHNVLLTLLSLGLLLLLVEQILPIIVRHGVFYSICSHGAWTQPIVTLYYLNYLTKYIELIDTVFLFLKKKPLNFLHYYHHGATALLCYSQLVGHTSVSYVPIVLNLTVHVLMYWYYFLSARGIRVWWKEWVTRTQIIQFVLDLGFVYFASYTYFAFHYFPSLPNKGSCAGEEFAALFGCGLLTSYLFLFIAFYAATYKKAGKKVANRKVSNGSIAIDPKFTSEDLKSLKVNGESTGAKVAANSPRSRKV